MTAQRTNGANGFATTLASPMGATDTSLVLTTASGLPAVPFYLVIDPENAQSHREVILVDTSVVGTTLTLSTTAKRYLAGSAAGSGLTHAAGEVVRMCVIDQLFDDIHDRIDLAYGPGLNDVLVTDGGTGASTASGARANLGLVIGTDIASQAALAAEAARAEGVEATLTTAIAAEATRAEGVEATNAAAIVTEAAARALLPLGLVAIVSVTADQGGITTATDLTSLTLTITAVAGRRYRWSFFGETQANAADGSTVVQITDSSGATQLKRAVINGSTLLQTIPSLVWTEKPGAGSITRKVRMLKSGGTGSVALNASATTPAFFMVEDMGTV